MKKTVLFASVLALFASTSALAGVQSGKRLGSVRLADAKDRDTVVLPPCKVSSNKKIDKIGFTVKGYGAEIDHLKVVFQNGDQQVLYVKDHFSVNSSSRWIDLNGTDRCIAKIVVKGDTNTRFFRPGKQAKVTFYGR